ncbi:MAG: SDR family oxidoreductase [Acidobacteria bacterium]|nr:SDR family oxidoreductase [Acidobacteriota bacterium]
MTSELSGKTAVVTGASRGIGAATAVALARSGCARIVVHYNSHRPGAEQVARDVQAAGAACDLLGGDLSTPAGIFAFIDDMKRAAPQVDILVNNAGHLVQRARLLEMSPDVYDRIMDLNVKSGWLITQAVVRSMIEQGSGAIIFVSSIAARNGGGPGATIYAAAKAAVATITKGLAKELAPKGIRVNGVSPGTVDNHFHEVYSTPEMLDNVVAMTPAGRLGTNEEVADTIVFLCTDPSRYIHGQTIEINGGLYMV